MVTAVERLPVVPEQPLVEQASTVPTCCLLRKQMATAICSTPPLPARAFQLQPRLPARMRLLAGKSAPSTPGHSVAAVHVTPDRSGDALADSDKPSASAAVPAASASSASCAEAPCSASPIVQPLQLAPDSPGARAAGDAWLDLALAMREQAARGRGVVPPVRDVEKRLLEEVGGHGAHVRRPAGEGAGRHGGSRRR